MGRGIMEMKFIENEKTRKKVLEKRKKNLLKKAKELSILCDSKILVIIFDQDKRQPLVWPNNDEATQMINKLKHKSAKGGGKKAFGFGSSASEKKTLGEKFPISDYHKGMINHLSENQLQNLCSELDAKIAAVMNVVEAKQQNLTEGQVMLVDEGNSNGKGKEVVMYHEPVPFQQDQSFQILYRNQNFMESPMMMMMPNVTFSYPRQFDGSSSSSNIPLVPLPIQYYDPSRMQQAYVNPNSLLSYHDALVFPALR